MSPFLFALLVEPLGELARAHEELGLRLPPLKGLELSPTLVITQFADDTTLFSDSMDKLRVLLRIINNEYCEASGMVINLEKKRVFSPLSTLSLDLNSRLSLHVMTEEDEIRSLGARYGHRYDPTSKFDDILDRMKHRMHHNVRRLPSLMARVLICNSMLSSLLWFFAYFPHPPSETNG